VAIGANLGFLCRPRFQRDKEAISLAHQDQSTISGGQEEVQTMGMILIMYGKMPTVEAWMICGGVVHTVRENAPNA
jgi:hypothetical protein